MWQALKAFFGAPLGKAAGLAAIKVWQVIAAITIVSASVGTYAYIRMNVSGNTNTPQQVIVFIGGLNTSMTNCEENTFQDYGHGRFLPLILSETAGVANPYIKGCNKSDPNMSYVASPSSMVRFSYNGGAMDSHGFWKPRDYQACTSVNKYPLQQDILTFDETLDAYHHAFPDARFTIVGHSLGGLVGLQGAYDYVINRGNHYIDKVITIDSPLKGVAPGSKSLRSILEAKCFFEGPVVEDLTALYAQSLKAAETHLGIVCDAQQLNLSWCQGQKLAQNGVGVVTLGNNKDSLYCGGATQTVAGLDFTCYTQTLGNVHDVLSQMYSLTPLSDEGYEVWIIHTPFGNGHFTILSMQETQLDIVRYIFAPVVTINQPTFPPGNGVSISTSGTTLPFSATVHCLWGTANHATAYILSKDGKTSFVGTSIPSDESDKLDIKGVVQLSSSLKNLTDTIYVEAGGDTCQYPTYGDLQIHQQVLPTNEDYFGGKSTGIPFTLTTGTPTTQISGSSSQSQSSNPSNDATFLARSNTLTVSAGQSFDVYFDYENTGGTVWSDANGYQLVCDANSVPTVNCMGGNSQGLNGIIVPPNDQATFYLTLTAPIIPGTYQLLWKMAQKGTEFGQSPTPLQIKVTPGPTAFISFTNNIYALNSLNGTQLWHFQLPGDYTTFFTTLTAGDGLLYFCSLNTVYALNMSNGKPRWHFDVEGSSYGSLGGNCLVLAKGIVYIFDSNGIIYALNANTGTILWRYSVPQKGCCYGIVSDETVYVGSNNVVYAINAGNGTLLWEMQTDNAPTWITESNGIVCVATDFTVFPQTIYAFRASDGKELWNYNNDNPGNDSIPVVGNGMIYVGTLQNVYALDINSGVQRWQQNAIIVDSMVLDNRILYISTQGDGLDAYDANTGTHLWNYSVASSISFVSSITLYDDSGFDGALGKTYVLDPYTGKLIWSYQAKDYHHSSGTSVMTDAVAYGKTYIDDGRYIYAFNASDGTPLWNFDTGSFGHGLFQVVVSQVM